MKLTFGLEKLTRIQFCSRTKTHLVERLYMKEKLCLLFIFKSEASDSTVRATNCEPWLKCVRTVNGNTCAL